MHNFTWSCNRETVSWTDRKPFLLTSGNEVIWAKSSWVSHSVEARWGIICYLGYLHTNNNCKDKIIVCSAMTCYQEARQNKGCISKNSSITFRNNFMSFNLILVSFYYFGKWIKENVMKRKWKLNVSLPCVFLS